MTAWAWLKVVSWKSVICHLTLNVFTKGSIIKIISSKLKLIQLERKIRISERQNERYVQKDISKFLPFCPPSEHLIEEFGQVYHEWNSNPGEGQVGLVEMEKEKVKEERFDIGRNVNNWE